jgi:hypothetical protein
MIREGNVPELFCIILFRRKIGPPFPRSLIHGTGRIIFPSFHNLFLVLCPSNLITGMPELLQGGTPIMNGVNRILQTLP